MHVRGELNKKRKIPTVAVLRAALDASCLRGALPKGGWDEHGQRVSGHRKQLTTSGLAGSLFGPGHIRTMFLVA